MASWWDDVTNWISDSWEGFTGQAQVEAQKEANKMNEQLTREQWAREDNAVQRRMADLDKAGINPLLAGGQPASASPAARMESAGAANPIGAMATLITGIINIQQTLAETALTQVQQQNVQSITTGQDLANAFNQGMNPLRKESMELELAFQKATNETAIQKVVEDLKGKKLDNINADLDAALKRAGADLTKAQTVYTKAQTALSGQNLTNAEKETVQRMIAIKTAGLENIILEDLARTAPGTADGLKKWLNLMGGVQDFIQKSMPNIPGMKF